MGVVYICLQSCLSGFVILLPHLSGWLVECMLSGYGRCVFCTWGHSIHTRSFKVELNWLYVQSSQDSKQQDWNQAQRTAFEQEASCIPRSSGEQQGLPTDSDKISAVSKWPCCIVSWVRACTTINFSDIAALFPPFVQERSSHCVDWEMLCHFPQATQAQVFILGTDGSNSACCWCHAFPNTEGGKSDNKITL